MSQFKSSWFAIRVTFWFERSRKAARRNGKIILLPSRLLHVKVNNRNTRTRCEICPKLTIKIPEQRHWRVFIVNFENISHLILVYLLLNLNMQLPAGLNLICEFNLGLDFSESSSAGISLFKVNNGITKTIYEICY